MTIPPIYRLNRSQLLLLRVVHDYDYLCWPFTPSAIESWHSCT